MALPVYEYRCGGGHRYEKSEGFSAPTEHACPHCGRTARRQLSVPAVIFKGAGFYSTDSRKSASGGDGAAGDAVGGSAGAPGKTEEAQAVTSDRGDGASHDKGSASKPEVASD